MVKGIGGEICPVYSRIPEIYGQNRETRDLDGMRPNSDVRESHTLITRWRFYSTKEDLSCEFRNLCRSLPYNGLCDDELKVKDIISDELNIGHSQHQIKTAMTGNKEWKFEVKKSYS